MDAKRHPLDATMIVRAKVLNLTSLFLRFFLASLDFLRAVKIIDHGTSYKMQDYCSIWCLVLYGSEHGEAPPNDIWYTQLFSSLKISVPAAVFG